MRSLAMVRVEPGSTPGIGITIIENLFFGLFRLLWDVFLLFAFSSLCDVFCFLQGELVACHSCSSRGVGRILRSTLLQILGFGDYILHQARQCR